MLFNSFAYIILVRGKKVSGQPKTGWPRLYYSWTTSQSKCGDESALPTFLQEFSQYCFQWSFPVRAAATVRVLLLTKLVQSHALMYEGREKAGWGKERWIATAGSRVFSNLDLLILEVVPSQTHVREGSRHSDRQIRIVPHALMYEGLEKKHSNCWR